TRRKDITEVQENDILLSWDGRQIHHIAILDFWGPLNETSAYVDRVEWGEAGPKKHYNQQVYVEVKKDKGTGDLYLWDPAEGEKRYVCRPPQKIEPNP